MQKSNKFNLFWKKAKKFFRIEFWSIVASVIFLLTWWQEKVTIEDSRSKLFEFYRLESEIFESQINLKNLELQTGSILADWKLSMVLSDKKLSAAPDTTSFLKRLFKGCSDEVFQENIIINTVEKKNNPDRDSFVYYDYEKTGRDLELSNIIATKKISVIVDYLDTSAIQFRAITDNLEKNSLPIANKLQAKINGDFSYYLLGYLFAGLVLTFSKIKKINL